jgi:hypothetical protein
MRQPIPPMPGAKGDPVRHFVGRAGTTLRAERQLAAGINLSLTDPRRMGKTWWLEHFCATTTAFMPVYIDYQGITTREEFLVRTAQALGQQRSLPAKVRSLLTSLFENIEEVGAGPVTIKTGVRSQTPTALLVSTVLAVDSNAEDKPVLVCMDEVPWAIRNITQNEGPQAASELLQALRAIRADGKHLRWIVCGSIGFHHVLRHCGATTGDINDLINLPLGPLEPDDAVELGHRLFLGADIRELGKAAEVLADRCGRVPYLMHAVALRLEETHRGQSIGHDEVHQAFTDYVDDRDDSRPLTHLLERLDTNYGDNTHLAMQILDHLALTDRPVPLAELSSTHASARLGVVVDNLVDDHYLHGVDGGLMWRYDVLRYIWVRRQRLEPTP